MEVTVDQWLPNEISIISCSLGDAEDRFDNDYNVQLVSCTSPSSHEQIFGLCNLCHVYWFSKFIDDAQTKFSGSKLVFCTEEDHEAFTVCAFLLGGYLIVHNDILLEDLSAVFESVSGLFQVFQDPTQTMSMGEGLTVYDGWRALFKAKTNGWLNFRDEESATDSCIDMLEYQHYDNPLNGFLHVIIPSKENMAMVKHQPFRERIPSVRSYPDTQLEHSVELAGCIAPSPGSSGNKPPALESRPRR